MNKYELAEMYKMSMTTLRRLLNVAFYEHLVPLGYEKSSKRISPCVYRKFIELYGEPLKESEL